jgi:phosphate transport system protein
MKRLEDRLDKVLDEIIEMHNLAKRGVEICLDALSGNENYKIEAVRIEKETDILDTEINFDCTSIIALFQPVARDLRFALGMIKISSSYERVADLVQEISMYEVEIPDEFYDLQKIILKMFDVIYKAFKGDKKNLKSELICLDDELDLMYSDMMEKLSQRECLVKDVLDIILIARHLERIGDLLLKIATRLIFIEEGRRVWIK